MIEGSDLARPGAYGDYRRDHSALTLRQLSRRCRHEAIFGAQRAVANDPQRTRGSSVFDEREIMEWTWRCQRSFALDARRLDDRPPLLDFGLLQCGKRLRHLLFTRGNFDSEVNKSLMDAWVRQRTPDGTVQLIDD